MPPADGRAFRSMRTTPRLRERRHDGRDDRRQQRPPDRGQVALRELASVDRLGGHPRTARASCSAAARAPFPSSALRPRDDRGELLAENSRHPPARRPVSPPPAPGPSAPRAPAARAGSEGRRIKPSGSATHPPTSALPAPQPGGEHIRRRRRTAHGPRVPSATRAAYSPLPRRDRDPRRPHPQSVAALRHRHAGSKPRSVASCARSEAAPSCRAS